MWDEEGLVGEEAHAAERRVTPLPFESLDVAAHDTRASDDPMNLPLYSSASSLGERKRCHRHKESKFTDACGRHCIASNGLLAAFTAVTAATRTDPQGAGGF